ncbi:ABC transporter permease [Bartonella sp. DGB2]|uniref:ABC transporter permease n=1 Tax=Bartonella sp. DGB2 TaxID=3388426 RepID=UPI00398FE709
MLETLSLLSLSEGGWGWVMLIGSGVTISLALCCLPLGLPLGLILALMTRSQSIICSRVAIIFSTIFRSLPELLTLFLVYNGGQILVQNALNYFNIPATFSINAFVAGIIGLGTVFAVFSCEAWLGAFQVVNQGQYEAAKALNLSYNTTFWRVIFPQLVRHALPSLSNNWLCLLKDTSLVSTISLIDLMRQTNLAAVVTKEPLLFYSAACILYLLFSAISSFILLRLERRVNAGFRKADA